MKHVMTNEKGFTWHGIMGLLLLLVLLLPVGNDALAAESEVPTAVLDGHIYRLYDTGMTWEAAVQKCEELGGHLVTITSSNEQAAVSGLLNSGSKNSYWIGGTKSASGGWEWITGEGWSYSYWASSQPDNYRGIENRLMVYRLPNPLSYGTGLGKWNDLKEDGTCNGEAFFGAGNFGFICEWEDTAVMENISGKGYLIQVVDEAGKPISGASVFFDGETKTTDDTGMVAFSAFSYQTPRLEVEKAGYYKWTNSSSNWKKSKELFETVILYPLSSSGLKLASAYYSNQANFSSTVDLLTKTKKINLAIQAPVIGDMDDGKFYLSCSAVDKNAVSSYEVWQGSKRIAASASGSFQLSNSLFSEGGNCFVKTIDANGKSVNTRINLTFAKNTIHDHDGMAVKLNGKSLSFEVGDEVPFIGGSTFKCDLPMNIPLTYEVNDEKIQVGFNVNVAGGKDEKTQLKETKEFISQIRRTLPIDDNGLMVGKLTGPQSMKYKSLIKNTNQWKFFKNARLDFLGYGEADLGSTTVKGSVILKFSMDVASFDFNTWVVVVPVTVQVKLSGEASAIGEISYNWGTNTLDGGVNANASVKLTAFGGIGVSKIVGAGAYGSATLKGNFALIPDPRVKSVDLTGELGVKAYFAWYTYEKPFAYNTWHLYTENTSRRVVLPDGTVIEDPSDELLYNLQKGLYDVSQYKKADLSYLKEEKNLIDHPEEDGEQPAVRAGELRSEFAALIQNTYRNANPVIVSDGNAFYAAFLQADPESGHVYTVVTKYDGNTWHATTAVEDDAILDGMPSLLVDQQGRIWLCYAQTAGDSYSGDSLMSYAQNQNIVVGLINPDTLAFTKSRVYTGSGYMHMQKLSLLQGKPTLVWVDSTVENDNSVLWPDRNVIYTAVCEGTAWQNPVVKASVDHVVTQVTAGENENGGISIACVLDEDNSYDTDGDRNLYLISGNNQQLMQESCVGSVVYSKIPGTDKWTFVWNDEEKLLTSDGEAVNLPGINGNYSIQGNVVYFSKATDSGAELYAMKYENGEWSLPIAITSGDGYFENLNIVSMNGKDYAFGLYTDVTIHDTAIEDKKDLVWTEVALVSDLRLVGIDYEEDQLAPNETVPVTLTVVNGGDHTVTGLEVYLDEARVLTSNEPLGMGEEKEFTVQVPCTDRVEEHSVSVREVGWTDYAIADNSMTFHLGYPDLNVALQLRRIGSSMTLCAVVSNMGIDTGSCSVRIMDADGVLLAEKETGEIERGAVSIVIYEPDWDSIEADELDFSALLVCNQEDLADHNNRDTIHVFNANRIQLDLNPDMVLPAGLQAIEEEAFAGTVAAAVRIPDGAKTIGSRAFANCVLLRQIEIPASVTGIAADAFDGSVNVIFFCPADSEAARYAEEHLITCVTE